MPSSVRAKQEKAQSKSTKPEVADEKSTNADGKDVKAEEKREHETPADSIERLLNQLKKCELAVCSDDVNKNTKRNENQNTESNPEKTDSSQKVRVSCKTYFTFNRFKKS